MPAACRVVKAPENIDEVAAALQRSEVINRVLRAFPHIGAAIRLINPAADMVDENIARHVIAHAVLREDRQTASIAALSTLVKSPKLGDVFTIDDKGYTTLPRKASGAPTKVHINDLLEGRKTARFNLTDAQKAAIKMRKDIWDDLRFDYVRFGGRMDLDLDLFPRVIDGWLDPKTGKFSRGDEMSPKSRYGGSPLSKGGSFVRSRAMNPDGSVKTSDEMVQAGWRYVDPDVALTSKGQEIARRTADAQFAQWLTKQPDILKKGEIIGKGAETGVHPARWGMVGFDATQVPALAGYYAKPEIAKYITDLMAVEKKAVIPGITWLVNESRGAIASTDFGTTGVQLLNALGADAGHLILSAATLGTKSKPSNIFGTAVGNAFKSFLSPTNLTRYYADNKALIDRWAPYLGGLKNSEYVSAMLKEPESSLVMRIPGMKPFARAFETSLDVAKIEYVKSLEKIMGENISRADKEALGGWVRNSTGMTSTARIGVSPRQQDIEATWLFFSPRFTRSLFAATATIFKMDKAGNEARLALGGFAAAATLTYLTAAAALGQTPDLDPLKNGRLNPDFFTIRIGDNRIGIGGGMRALSRLMADSYEAAKTDPTRFISPSFRGADSNPFLSFWRSRSSPLFGTAMDIWTGQDFKGAPINDANDWGRAVMSRTLPFSLQAALEAKGQAFTKTGIALISGFGLNTNPVTNYQLYDEYLKSVRNADGTQRFPDGANTAQTNENGFRQFLQSDDQASHLKSAYEQSRLTGANPGANIQKILDERQHRIEAADALLAQTGDYRRYRTQINQIRADSRSTMEALHLDSVTQSGDKSIVQSWYETYKDPAAVDPVTGGINSDGLEQIQEAWKAAHPGEWERLIEPNEAIGSTPMETELKSDRKTISDAGWWDSDQRSWDKVKELLANRAVGQRLGIDQYKTFADYMLGRTAQYTQQFADRGVPLPQLRADIAMQKDKLVSMFHKIRTRDRLLLQRDNPGLTALLDKWGYNHTSLKEYKMAVAQQRQQEAGGYIQPTPLGG